MPTNAPLQGMAYAEYKQWISRFWPKMTYPTQSEASGPIDISSSATANTKGSYVQAIASTSFAWTHIVLTASSTAATKKVSIYIATGGAGSEVEKVKKLGLYTIAGGIETTHSFPFTVAAGTRVSCACEDTAGSGSATVWVTGLG